MGTDNKVREKNIIYTGDGEGMAHINTPTGQILLPEPIVQKKGFYHADAKAVIQMFPHLYKRVKPKGEK
jgi:hypothetical protein